MSRPVFDTEPGGCSVGKYLLNLRVVSCSQRVNLPDAIDISPADDPGIGRWVKLYLVYNTLAVK